MLPSSRNCSSKTKCSMPRSRNCRLSKFCVWMLDWEWILSGGSTHRHRNVLTNARLLDVSGLLTTRSSRIADLEGALGLCHPSRLKRA